MSSITICGPESEDHVDYVKAFRRVLKLFLVVATVLIFSLSLKNETIKRAIQPLNFSGASAHSNTALFIFNDCMAQAQIDLRKATRIAEVAKEAESLRLKRYGVTYSGIITVGALLTEGLLGLLGIPVGIYLIDWDQEISKIYDQSVSDAVSNYDNAARNCSEQAQKLDEELRYVDESERNIHFEFASGSIQYGFLNISPTPKGHVSLVHIRGNQ
ncbi:MAG: hypothetical protein NWS78_12625 [Gammaproteobacteria bacterium]|jgi:hypothetical protein|nr:hypothetical protein [Gammaproteobacteria bacterium]